ncbi:hypothetical protein [Deinococcus sp. 6GRE01]|uniref:hypothetical protein n=1 Tax=Deinococcus sp. 6GRE01 TaxID=2745873 RepID=UPI001E5A6AEC|nr:hypothetical protein [Deinococcus sp. 6GRE01]MCD0156287.1 hypothetical protein [Deinococcus sp. 6GRE01]
MKKAPENLRFATAFHENRPVKLGDTDFWSKRLNGQEEMILQHVNMSSIGTSTTEPLQLEVTFLTHALQARVRDGRTVTEDWVMEHVGKANADTILTYLRTGQGLAPTETFDRPTFGNVEIGDRTFHGLALNYAESLAAATEAQKADALTVAQEAQDLQDQAELKEGETVQEMLDRLRTSALSALDRTQAAQRLSADITATILNARITDGGDPITGEWLLQNLQVNDISAIGHYLRAGTMPDPEEAPDGEGEDGEYGGAPNADGAGEASR